MEVQATLHQFPGGTINEDDFVSALLDTSTWQSVMGPLVLKAMFSYYNVFKYLSYEY
jgi:hypothetical protein